jgi:hypothetical protein
MKAWHFIKADRKLGYGDGRTVIKSIDATDIVIKFTILEAMSVYKDAAWAKWANDWLSGVNRTAYAANAANAARDANHNQIKTIQNKVLESMLLDVMGII